MLRERSTASNPFFTLKKKRHKKLLDWFSTQICLLFSYFCTLPTMSLYFSVFSILEDVLNTSLESSKQMSMLKLIAVGMLLKETLFIA